VAGGLTPKAIIWIVMQITKIHFLTSAALVVANGEARQTTAAGSGDAFADGLGRMYAGRGLNQLNSSASRALFNMDLIISFVVAFAVGFGAGYATRERKSRRRRRRYYHADSAD
jgi:hypothetical protein